MKARFSRLFSFRLVIVCYGLSPEGKFLDNRRLVDFQSPLATFIFRLWGSSTRQLAWVTRCLCRPSFTLLSMRRIEQAPFVTELLNFPSGCMAGGLLA